MVFLSIPSKYNYFANLMHFSGNIAVKLPELMFHANIEEETFIELMQKINDFLKYKLNHPY